MHIDVSSAVRGCDCDAVAMNIYEMSRHVMKWFIQDEQSPRVMPSRYRRAIAGVFSCYR